MRITSNVRGGARRSGVRFASGFTLVEILMVVIIIGIAGALIVPQMGARDDMRAAAARIVMADLVYAQNLAITRQVNHYVRFDVANGTYTLLSSPSMATVTHPVEKRPYSMTFGASGTNGLRECRLESAAFTGTTATVYLTIGFDELGTPLVYPDADPAQTMSSGSVRVKSGNYALDITVEPYTGQINVAAVP